MPIRRGPRRRLRRHGTAGARPVFHDEGLAEGLAQLRQQQPDRDIRRAAGGKGRQDAHRPLRPGGDALGAQGRHACEAGRRRTQRAAPCQLPDGSVHDGASPLACNDGVRDAACALRRQAFPHLGIRQGPSNAGPE
jgi:hypothetical protein